LASTLNATPARFLDASAGVSDLVPFPTLCESAVVLESGGQRYLAVALGTSAATGTTLAGSDLTKINIFILDIGTGAVLRTQQIRPRNNRFFYSLGTEYMDYDGDGDDEIVEVTLGYQPVSSGKQRTTAYVRVFDARFGTLEKSFSLWHFTTRKNANL
jgi:hypothetical protein